MANGYDPRVARLIDLYAAKYHVDPAAVKADALGEGGVKYGAVGDNGTSFGPFQLHIGGALPQQHSTSAAAAAAFANSPAGIEYAIRKMAESGAAGLQGQAALASIVRDFERPKDIPGQIAKRSQFLGQFGSDSAPAPGAPTLRAPSLGSAASGSSDLKTALAGYLLSSAQNAAAGKMPDFGSIAQLAQMRTQLQAAQSTYGSTPTQGDLQSPATMPRASKTGGGIDWEGKPLSGESQGFLNQVTQAATAAGATRVRVISGYRSPGYNREVGGAGNSNHTYGHALDGEAFVPGKGWVPLGTLLRNSANKFGLRSGDQAGFFNGRPDPNHVDDAFNQR